MRLHKFNRRWALIKLNLRQNKEKYIRVGTLVFSIVIFIIGITFFAFAKYNTTTKFKPIQTTVGSFSNGDYTMLAYVDGVKSDTIPTSTDGYTVYNITCNNSATGKWDTTNWSLVISGATASGTKCNVYFGKLNNFDYTGDVQTFIAPSDGYYKLEAWGAQGGNSSNSSKTGGNGGYSSGLISLNKGAIIYVVSGQAGNNASATTTFNGGGGGASGGGYTTGGSGGGATDFRLINGAWNDSTSLASRIMVAGGGGGTDTTNVNGGVGGGLTGGVGLTTYTSSVTVPTGGNQISGGTGGAGGQASNSNGGLFGIGGAAVQTASSGAYNGGGGGSGYFGGGGGGSYYSSSGAGGSSYISGYTGCVAIASSTDIAPKSGCTTGTTDINCSYHYSGKIFTNPIIKAGNETMPAHDGIGTMTGNSGNGYAKITYVGLTGDETNDVMYTPINKNSIITVSGGQSNSGSTFSVAKDGYTAIYAGMTGVYKLGSGSVSWPNESISLDVATQTVTTSMPNYMNIGYFIVYMSNDLYPYWKS